jgi:two-component system, sensor histidine kinase YesM
MGKFGRFFNFVSIRQKIMFVISISIFLTLLFTMIIFYTVLEVNNRQLFDQVSSNILLAAENLGQKLTTIQQFSYIIVSDREIQNLLIDQKDTGDYIAFSKASDGINTILSIYHDQLRNHHVDYILFEGLGISAGTYTPRTGVLPEEIKNNLIEQSLDYYGSFFVTEYSKTYGIFLVYPIRRFIRPRRFDYLGTLIISINPLQLLSKLSPEDINLSEIQYALYDNSFNSIFSSDSLVESLELESMDYSSISYSLIKESGSTFMITGRKIFMDWVFFALVPYSYLLRISNILKTISFFIVSAIGLLSISITYNILRNSFSRPIHELVVQMKSFGVSIEPLSSIKDQFIDRRDEIGYLYTSFERMTKDIVRLVEVNYKNELLFKESQLQYLQAQINPHFLFNTLDSISWRAKLSNDPITPRIVESLSVLLRGSLSDKKIFSLHEEIELVKHYLNIQQIRYGEQVTCSIHCPKELLDLCFPHMVLQPVIENAIKYSLEFNGEQCHIDLCAISDRQTLTVKIENSGSQFEDNHIQKLEKGMITASGFGIGLLNIQQRIQLYYGDGYGLYLYNENDKAVVEIKIPYQEKEDADAANDDC